jgi:hypothetical protein
MHRLTELWDFLNGVHFVDWKFGAGVALLAFLLWLLWSKLKRSVAITSVRVHRPRGVAVRMFIVAGLLLAFWFLFAAALAGPHYMQSEHTSHYEARSFVIGIDRSGSMGGWDIEAPDLAAQVDAWQQDQYQKYLALREKYPLMFPNEPEPPMKRSPGTNKAMIQRFSAGIYVARLFLESRPDSDRFGMFTFDDRCYWVEPVGKDRHLLLDSLREISRKGGGGTNFDTEEGAFQQAINHFRDPQLNKTRVKVIIFISDGDAGISPQRHQQLVEQMTQPGQEVHIYALVCGPEASVNSPTTESLRKLMAAVNPDDDKRPEFKDTVIWCGNGKKMKEAFELINRLETSPVESEAVMVDKDVAWNFILAGSATLALFLVLCVVFREET